MQPPAWLDDDVVGESDVEPTSEDKGPVVVLLGSPADAELEDGMESAEDESPDVEPVSSTELEDGRRLTEEESGDVELFSPPDAEREEEMEPEEDVDPVSSTELEPAHADEDNPDPVSEPLL